ncbi:beta-galactoside alpha-(2,6)-sialyltransferase [Ranunculus cassubicifolius]
MASAREKRGQLVYMIYRAMTITLSPFLYLHLHYRRLKGLEHPLRWPERLGRPSLPRPPGPLLWFHAVSLGESMAAIPVIEHCIQQKQQPRFTVLMTTTTNSAFNVIKDRLPADVIYQFAPLDTPAAMDSFLEYWSPHAIVLMESELWPNLILGASRKGIMLALLNARVSPRSLRLWSGPVGLPLISLMLSKFFLIAPLSTQEAIHFQLLHAPPLTICFPGDLKYAVGNADVPGNTGIQFENLQQQLANRRVWMASSIHEGEEEVMLDVHKELTQIYPDSVLIIVPRHPHQGRKIAQAAQGDGHAVVLRSCSDNISANTNIYMVDTLGELRSLYRITPIAVIGGSFLPGLAGHNISEAAAAGCAVLTGSHVGHFSQMVSAMQRESSLSVCQVSGKRELVETLSELFSDSRALEARRAAAKQAFLALSTGIVGNVWNLLSLHLLQKS